VRRPHGTDDAIVAMDLRKHYLLVNLFYAHMPNTARMTPLLPSTEEKIIYMVIFFYAKMPRGANEVIVGIDLMRVCKSVRASAARGVKS